MEICCDICGDIGYKEALIRCSRCKINIEHMYCMRLVLIEPPTEWHCEDCKPISTILSVASNLIEEPSKSVQGRHDDDASSSMWHAKTRRQLDRKRDGSVWEKKVETGKTKFLSANEVMALNSGTYKSVPQRASAIKITSQSTPPLTVAVPSRAFSVQIADASGSSLQLSKRKKATELPKVQRMRSIAKINTFSNPPPVTVLQNRARRNSSPEQILGASGSSQKLKRKEFGNMELPEVQESQSRKRIEVTRKASRNEDWIDDYMQKKEPSVVKLQQSKEKSIKERSLASSPLLIAPPGFNGSGVNGGNHGHPSTLVDENLHLNLLSGSNKFISTAPAADVLWKGRSSIWDTNQETKQNIDLQVNPSARIRRKAYELSKKLPGVLSFNLVSSEKFWGKLFPNHSPDKRDIGLYFFCHDTESSESYTSLVDNIFVKDLALRALITADVELMVFPSTCFAAGGQYWEGKNFLWGIFRRLKGDEITTPTVINKGKLPMVNFDDGNYSLNDKRLTAGGTQFQNCNEDEDNDMELDMVGGVAVGVTDVVAAVVRKEKKPIVEVKVEKPLGVPPGFENRFSRNRS